MGKGEEMCGPKSDHASQYWACILDIQCGGAKLEHAKFSTVGMKGKWRNIYIIQNSMCGALIACWVRKVQQDMGGLYVQ